jgi:hypothetical protein
MGRPERVCLTMTPSITLGFLPLAGGRTQPGLPGKQSLPHRRDPS